MLEVVVEPSACCAAPETISPPVLETRGLSVTIGGRAIPRSYVDAPEIDGVVHIAQGRGLKPGDFVRVRITRSDDYDLWGKPVLP